MHLDIKTKRHKSVTLDLNLKMPRTFLAVVCLLLLCQQSVHCSRPLTSYRRVPCESVCTNYYNFNSKSNYRRRVYPYKWCSVPGFPYWDYCSLSPSLASHDAKCTSSCARRGYSYHWCYTDDTSWGYCSPDVLETEPSVTTSAYYCKNECASRGEDYFWCELNFSGIWWWDYCSTSLKFDIYGYECTNDCGFRRYNYLWCNSFLYWQRWNYCGLPPSNNGSNSYSANVAP